MVDVLQCKLMLEQFWNGTVECKWDIVQSNSDSKHPAYYILSTIFESST